MKDCTAGLVPPEPEWDGQLTPLRLQTCVLRASEAPQASGEIINVATGGRISLNQLFYAMRDLVGGALEPVYAESRKGDVRDSQADIRKAKALLGYEPVVSFEDGLARTIAWYRSSRAATPA